MSKSTGRCARNDPDANGDNVVLFPGSSAQKHYGHSQNNPGSDVQTTLVSDLFPGSREVTDDTRDRMIRLETEVKHVTAQLEDVQGKVDEMHNLLMQAKGMKYLIIIMATVGGALASFAAKYIPFFRS